jgi:hypothetical protein
MILLLFDNPSVSGEFKDHVKATQRMLEDFLFGFCRTTK